MRNETINLLKLLLGKKIRLLVKVKANTTSPIFRGEIFFDNLTMTNIQDIYKNNVVVKVVHGEKFEIHNPEFINIEQYYLVRQGYSCQIMQKTKSPLGSNEDEFELVKGSIRKIEIKMHRSQTTT